MRRKGDGEGDFSVDELASGGPTCPRQTPMESLSMRGTGNRKASNTLTAYPLEQQAEDSPASVVVLDRHETGATTGL